MRGRLGLVVLSVAFWGSTGWAETALRIIPPTGATFAPGQRLDIRVEADDLKGQPGALSFAIDGRDAMSQVFGQDKFQTFNLTIRIPPPPPPRGTAPARGGTPAGGAGTRGRGATTGAAPGAGAAPRGGATPGRGATTPAAPGATAPATGAGATPPISRGGAGATGAGAAPGGATAPGRGAGQVAGAVTPGRGVITPATAGATPPAATPAAGDGGTPPAPRGAAGATGGAGARGTTGARGATGGGRGATASTAGATGESDDVEEEGGTTITLLNGGVIRRNWTFDKPGTYELTASLVQADGTRLTAKSIISVLALEAAATPARNIILFIGDGMGQAERTAARIVSKGVVGGRARGLLEMDQMETIGLVMTSSLDALVTDSSPGASSWATGNKSSNNWHGVYPDNTGPATLPARVSLDRTPKEAPPFLDNPRVENIAELLQRTRRMSTGVVSTVAVTDSTPGAFSSHAIRYAQSAIAEQLLSSGHSVILGGGAKYFLPKDDPLLQNIVSARADTRNIVDEFKKAGYAFVANATELKAVGGVEKLLGLFHGGDFTSRYDRMRAVAGNESGKEAVGRFPDQPTLETMTEQAIKVLSKNPNGFFLMVEAGSVDRELHRIDPNRSVDEVIELDKAIGVARAWAAQPGHEDTLILVTADHETSGLALTGVNENGRASSRAFPTYVDKDTDGFPDSFQPELSLTFDFASGFNPPRDNRVYDLPRNLKDLNPSTTMNPGMGGVAGHSAVDVPIGARGRGASLFNGTMDNTEIFFRMLRALGPAR